MPRVLFTQPAPTVIVMKAVWLPSTVVTVIMAVPLDMPVTSPVALTVATAGLLLLHVTEWFVALAGSINARNVSLAPTSSHVGVEAANMIPSTGLVAGGVGDGGVGDGGVGVGDGGVGVGVGGVGTAVTVIVQMAVLLPSRVVAVIMAVPSAMAVTTPDELTVATVASSVVHIMVVIVASDGVMVAISVSVRPFSISVLVLFSDMLSTGRVQ